MCLFASRQVILVGAVHFLGGMMMRIPLWRLPLIDPPLASTMKLTRNLRRGRRKVRGDHVPNGCTKRRGKRLVQVKTR